MYKSVRIPLEPPAPLSWSFWLLSFVSLKASLGTLCHCSEGDQVADVVGEERPPGLSTLGLRPAKAHENRAGLN